MCPHTCIYNVITLLKMFLLHVHTHRGRKYLSVQQVSFLRGGIILLWASYVLLNVQLAFSISNTYCIYNQKEKKKSQKRLLTNQKRKLVGSLYWRLYQESLNTHSGPQKLHPRGPSQSSAESDSGMKRYEPS